MLPRKALDTELRRPCRARPSAEQADTLPAFHKYNSASRKTAKQRKVAAATAKAAALRSDKDASVPRSGGLRDLPGRVPFVHLVITAVVAHRIWCMVSRRLFRGQQDGAAKDGEAREAESVDGGADGVFGGHAGGLTPEVRGYPRQHFIALHRWAVR